MCGCCSACGWGTLSFLSALSHRRSPQPEGLKCHFRADGRGQLHGCTTCAVSYTRLNTQKGLELNLMLCCCSVKALIISSLSWRFCKRSLVHLQKLHWGSGACTGGKEIPSIHGSVTILATLLAWTVPREHRVPVGPWCVMFVQ